jgi:hypothetical protein
MVGHKFLLIISALIPTILIFGVDGALADTGTCSVRQTIAGGCAAPSAAVNGGGVDLSAGSGSESGETGGQAHSGNNGSDGGSGLAPVKETYFQGQYTATDSGQSLIAGGAPQVIVRDAFGVICISCAETLTVYTRDLVNFQALPPTRGMEPSGWLVVGLPTNFYASAAAHTESGILLGEPAEVRFTPAAYHWDYGDGSTGHSSTGGGTWAALNLPEFSSTETSHVFHGTGRHAINSAVEYTAEYRYAGAAWLAVLGSVFVPADELIAVGGRSRTVLVAHNCLERPNGPGC